MRQPLPCARRGCYSFTALRQAAGELAMRAGRKAVPVRSSIAGGRRFATYSIALQLGITLLLAAVWAAAQGTPAALAVGFGGGAVALGNALFALSVFGAGAAPARQALRGLYAGEALKLGLSVVMLYVAIAVLELPFLPLLTGLVLAQIVFWIALVAIR